MGECEGECDDDDPGTGMARAAGDLCDCVWGGHGVVCADGGYVVPFGEIGIERDGEPPRSESGVPGAGSWSTGSGGSMLVLCTTWSYEGGSAARAFSSTIIILMIMRGVRSNEYVCRQEVSK